MKRYDPINIEQKWQQEWRNDSRYQAENFSKKDKFYVSCMFPYPSGAGMHAGHAFEHSIVDAVARYKRAKGYNVMNPMGWDAFGLPAENYAIKTGKAPAEVTKTNIGNFIKQQNKLGLSIDWTREINTTDPAYYRWTQWIFKQLFNRGLAYQKEASQWWCPVDKTVLANEQVESGNCWRCGEKVEKRNMKQWFFKITEYADELLQDIDTLNWPEKIKIAQTNWIGKSVGAEVEFKIKDSNESIKVFTTRPDTIFGVGFLALAPESELLKRVDLKDKDEEVKKYIDKCAKKTEIERLSDNKDKSGVFTGLYAINPINNEEVKIYVAEYVLGGYGTGAVMGVPCHDERDFEFAKKHEIKSRSVIESETDGDIQTEKGLLINSGEYSGLNSDEASEKIIEKLNSDGLGSAKTTFKIRDWLISRQRYWGAPIPIVHTEDGPIAVADSCLPVVLPEIENYQNNSNNTSVLASVEDWVNVWVNKKTGETLNISESKPDGEDWVEGKRETDTLDGYACSSWYLLRYTDPNNDNEAWSKDKVNYWAPVDMYVGGDHAVAHLLYVRFWTHVFKDMGLTEFKEPVDGLVYHGYINAEDGTKMSKSKGNVIDPIDIIDQGYGADTFRTFVLFLGPIEENSNWSSTGISGVYRFLNRIWTLIDEYVDAEKKDKKSDISSDIKKVEHKTIKKVTESFDRLSFNTAIAALMEFVNELYKFKKNGFSEEWQNVLENLIQMVAPFAPHMAAECWEILGNKDSLDFKEWPKYQEEYLKEDFITIIIQVNGKLRAKIEVDDSTDKDSIIDTALMDENVKKFTDSKDVAKTIYVPGKLVNFVVK